jgi:hypothetical protein
MLDKKKKATVQVEFSLVIEMPENAVISEVVEELKFIFRADSYNGAVVTRTKLKQYDILKVSDIKE